MSEQLLPGYCLRVGSSLDRALLVKFMQRTYQDLSPGHDFSHLARTVEQYLSTETPLWWVDFVGEGQDDESNLSPRTKSRFANASRLSPQPVACLWVGNAIDQVRGDRHTHIFLLYVKPEHRRRGVGKALMRHVENWAIAKGDRQIGLQVFQFNSSAINLYNQLGYQTQSLWMVKSLPSEMVE